MAQYKEKVTFCIQTQSEECFMYINISSDVEYKDEVFPNFFTSDMLNNPDITTIDQLTQRNKIMRYKITRPEPKFYIYELYSLLVFYNIETIYNFIINNNDNINKLITNINLLKNLNYEVEIMTNHHNLKYLVITEKDQPDTPISMILSEGILALLLIFIKYLEFEISGKNKSYRQNF